jgi:ATP-dependent 26S proteasome regulatory subunit
LTTNRITSLDIAVQSRIHLAIRYKDLNKEQKTKIFNIFLSQLISEGKVDQQGIQPWIEMVGSDAELNGRQIRNIVSSAYVLAHRKGRKLEKEDLGMVYGIMRRFQKQLEPLTVSARKQNEGANS